METINQSSEVLTTQFLDLGNKILKCYYDFQKITSKSEISIYWAYFGSDFNLEIEASPSSINQQLRKITRMSFLHEENGVAQSVVLRDSYKLNVQQKLFAGDIYAGFNKYIQDNLDLANTLIFPSKSPKLVKPKPRIELFYDPSVLKNKIKINGEPE